MFKAFTISEAKPKLGRLLDNARDGHPVYLRRKERLFRIEPVSEIQPIANRPFGYFTIEARDPVIALANSAPANFLVNP